MGWVSFILFFNFSGVVFMVDGVVVILSYFSVVCRGSAQVIEINLCGIDCDDLIRLGFP